MACSDPLKNLSDLWLFSQNGYRRCVKRYLAFIPP